MAIYVGSARIDERGCASGGMSGDQGREVCVEPYYVHPLGWYCLRAKDPKKAELIAKEMKEACDNQNIGYDQNQRLDIIKAITKAKTMSAITWKTECDCSSLVRACVMAAGMGDPGNFTTYNEGAVLLATGQFEPRITVSGSTKLYTGDILVTRKKGHTVIVTKGEPREAAKPSEGGLSKEPKWVGVVTAGLLNVRSNAGIEYPNIKSYPMLARGNKVDVCDTVKAKDGGTWYYVRIKSGSKYVFGFVSANYITKA